MTRSGGQAVLRSAGNPFSRIAVLGAGSWGTALAIALARNGVRVELWARSAEHIGALERAGENARYLPGCAFPELLGLEAGMQRAVHGADCVLVVVPSHALRSLLADLRPILPPGMPVVWATKGLEPESALLPHQVAQEVLPDATARGVVAGPTFAGEIARGQPSAITVASTNGKLAAETAGALHGGSLRAYTSDDVVGVEIGGAVKNVLAIGIGISDGLGFGANARAALLTRGLAEMTRLGKAAGANFGTLTGLTGMGDLALTCTDDQSRNRRMGLLLARGYTRGQAQGEIGQVVEGVRVSREVRRLAHSHGVEMPISEQVYQVLHEGRAPHDAVEALTRRPPGPESA